MNQKSTLGLNLQNLKWWQAGLLILCLAFASMEGVSINANVSLQGQVTDLQRQLSIPVNSSLSGLTKEANFILSMVDAFCCMQRGNDSSLAYFNTNVTLVEQCANGNLSASGGMIFLKDLQWNSTLSLGDKVFVVESYQGQLKYYSNQGKFLITQLASDPSTDGWGTAEQGRIWYNTVSQTYKYWNGTAVVALGAGGGGTGPAGPAGTVGGLPFSYLIFNNATATYMVNGATGNIDFQSTNASQVLNNALGNTTSGGTVFVKAGTYTLTNSIIIYPTEGLMGEGQEVTIFLAANNLDAPVILESTSVGALDGTDMYMGYFSVHGNSAGQTSRSDGIVLGNGLRNSRFVFIRIQDCNGTGFWQKGSESTTFQFYLNQIFSYNNKNDGFQMDGSNNRLDYCFGNLNGGRGIFINNSYQNVLSQCEFEANTLEECYVYSSHQDNFYGCAFGPSGTRNGLVVNGSYAEVFSGGLSAGSAVDGILLGSSPTEVSYNNRFDSVQLTSNTKYGVEEFNNGSGVPSGNRFINCNFDSNGAGPVKLPLTSTTDRFTDNIGFITENSGRTSIANLGTIAHGLESSLNVAADECSISLTPYVDPIDYGGHSLIATVWSVSSTLITVNLYFDNGTACTSSIAVYWRVAWMYTG